MSIPGEEKGRMEKRVKLNSRKRRWKGGRGAGIITALALCSSLALAATKKGICVPAQFYNRYLIARLKCFDSPVSALVYSWSVGKLSSSTQHELLLREKNDSNGLFLWLGTKKNWTCVITIVKFIFALNFEVDLPLIFLTLCYRERRNTLVFRFSKR